MEEHLVKETERKSSQEKEVNKESLVSRKPRESFVSRRCEKQYQMSHICSHWMRQRGAHW